MNVIGLVGQAGTGKDTVADHLVQRYGHVRVALADVMKRFAQDALGFDVVTLWGPSEKRQNVIDSRIPDVALFRNKAKRFARTLLPGQADKAADLGNRLVVWGHGLEQHGPEVSARIVLQTLGTEVGRACDPDVWVRYLFEQVIPYVGSFDYYPALGLQPRSMASVRTAKHGLVTGNDVPGVVISDVRFRNEVDAVLKNGGKVYRLVRQLMPTAPDAGGVAGHASETEQAEIPDAILTGVWFLPEGLDALAKRLDIEHGTGAF